MEDIRIYCENTRSYVKVMMGTTLSELSGQLCPTINDNMQVLAALVDNKLKSLDYKIINPHNVRFALKIRCSAVPLKRLKCE